MQLPCRSRAYLPAPAFANNSPRHDGTGRAFSNSPNETWNLLDGSHRVGRSLEKRSHSLTFLGSVGRKPSVICVLPEEKIRHVDLVLFILVAVRQQISTLQRLRTESEDVIDDQDSLLD